MYQRLLTDAAFYRVLLRFDEELAAAERTKGCRVCGKRLEASDFPGRATHQPCFPVSSSKNFPWTFPGGEQTQCVSRSAAAAAVSIASGEPDAVCMRPG